MGEATGGAPVGGPLRWVGAMRGERSAPSPPQRDGGGGDVRSLVPR